VTSVACGLELSQYQKNEGGSSSAGSLPKMALDPTLLDWLLDSDPALRWQVERALVGVPLEAWGATRARIASEGFGARLLAVQDADGQWAGVDRNDVVAKHASRLGPRCRCPRRHRGLAHREQPLGIRRLALLGRRG
jgi:hypothetical protein